MTSGTAIKRLFQAVLLTVFLAGSAILDASTSILLSEGEQGLIDEGEIIVREVGTGNRPGKTFEAIGRINASRNTILQVLTEYEKYPLFMPNVSRIDIVEQKADEAILDYTLTLPLRKIKKYRLKISVAEQGKKSSMLQWQLQLWPGLKTAETIKDTTGYWLINEETPESSLVLYHVYTDPGPVPFGLGWIIDVLSKNSVPEALLQTRARTEEITQKRYGHN